MCVWGGGGGDSREQGEITVLYMYRVRRSRTSIIWYQLALVGWLPLFNLTYCNNLLRLQILVCVK